MWSFGEESSRDTWGGCTCNFEWELFDIFTSEWPSVEKDQQNGVITEYRMSEPTHIRTSKSEIVKNRPKMNQFLYITANSPQGLQQVVKADVPCSVSVLSSFLFFPSCFCFHLFVCRESQPLRGLKENTNRKFFSLCPLEGSRSSMRSQGWVGGVLDSRGWAGGFVSCHYPWSFEASVWATNTNPQMPNLVSDRFIYKKDILGFSLL